VRKAQNIDSRHALQIIESSDHDRAGFHKYFFSVDWYNPSEYDMTLTTDRFDPIHAAAAIDAFRKSFISDTQEMNATAKMQDLLLGAKIVTEITYNRKIPIHFWRRPWSAGWSYCMAWRTPMPRWTAPSRRPISYLESSRSRARSSLCRNSPSCHDRRKVQ
jgi:hypothetical protein